MRFCRPGRRTVGLLSGVHQRVIHRPLWITLLIVWNTPPVRCTACWPRCGRRKSSPANTASDLRKHESQPVERRFLVHWCSPVRHLGPRQLVCRQSPRQSGIPTETRGFTQVWWRGVRGRQSFAVVLASPSGHGSGGQAAHPCGREGAAQGAQPRPGPGDPPARRTRLPRPRRRAAVPARRLRGGRTPRYPGAGRARDRHGGPGNPGQPVHLPGLRHHRLGRPPGRRGQHARSTGPGCRRPVAGDADRWPLSPLSCCR